MEMPLHSKLQSDDPHERHIDDSILQSGCLFHVIAISESMINRNISQDKMKVTEVTHDFF